MSMVLNSENVNSIFDACISTTIGQDCIHTKSLHDSYYFNKKVLDKYSDDISCLVNQLPWESDKDNQILQVRKMVHKTDSTVWTSKKEEVDHLLALGLAANKLKFVKGLKYFIFVGNRMSVQKI